MGIFKKIIGFLKHNYWLVILLLVCISYGQTLLMVPWQDDNALFFKLAHIIEPAGFLGKGILGEGPYKYTAFFYYPIYLIFGYQTFYYYLLGFLLYFLSTLILYKVSVKIIGEEYGKITAFLYACGYIASDGYIRLFNTVVTSLSVIFISLLLYFYQSYSKNKKNWFYLFSILFFWLASEFAKARTHYLIGIIILLELLLIGFRNKIKDFYQSILRLVPFLFIFYYYFIQNGDARSKRVLDYLTALLKGDLSILYGFLASLSNLIVPDWLTVRFHFLIYSLLSILVIYFLFRKLKKGWLILATIPLSIFWYFISKKIYFIPTLNPNPHQLGLVFFGGVIFMLLLTIFFYIRREYKVYYLLFFFWLLINLASYSAYSPDVIFESINRYLPHSFFALVLLLGIIFQNFNNTKYIKYIIVLMLLIFSLGNLIKSFYYQRNLLNNRTKPVRSFYQQLKIALPQIDKGDMLYFDVADSARSYFVDAFSVAQMPETTAIAWRYGVDRYDFLMAENYNDFVNQITENKIAVQKIHTFFYSKEGGLISTDNEFKKLGQGVSQTEIILGKDLFEPYYFQNIYSCVIQPRITLTVSAKPNLENDKLLSDKQFPLAVAQSYAKAKKDFYGSAKVLVSSNWRERVSSNLKDWNTDTVWQADRVTWDEEKTFFGFDLGKISEMERFVWINAFANNTPTVYSVEVSMDGKVWKKVAQAKEILRIENGKPVETKFPPTEARFIRMVISKTLNSDSAGISEAWVVPAGFGNYKIADLESIAGSPQVARLNNVSLVAVSWKSNSSTNWQKDATATFKLITDGLKRDYEVLLPCKGTFLKGIKLEGFQFPVILNFEKIQVSYQ